jgi:hypothetical protein
MVNWKPAAVKDTSLGDLQKASHGIDSAGVTYQRVSDVYYLYNMPFHNLDEDGDTMYIGYTDGESWLVKKLVTTGAVLEMTYALMEDNDTYLGYSSAWVDRENLVYVNLEGA